MGRIAILRGEALNPFELQSYQPLTESHDIFGIGSRHGLYDLRAVSMPVVRLGQAGHGRIGRRLAGHRSGRLRGLDRVLSNCSIVHSAETFLPISEQAAQARARYGFKLVLTCWENIPFLHEDDVRLVARKQLVREAADLFVAVTQRAREALLSEEVASDRIVVQQVGIDRSIFRPGRRDNTIRRGWAVPDGWSVVLYCGRLIREKGVLDLVRALPGLPTTILVLAGVGPERLRLEIAAKALGVGSRVRFVGGVDYSKMWRLYSAADVCCFPSLSTPYWEEQFGMVLLEAMASGTPVVTTATGSIAEVVGDAAILVPPYAPVVLSSTLEGLLSDVSRRAELAERGLQLVSDRYDANAIAASIGQMYDRLLR